ncbi:Hsp70 family protein [Flavobacterium sp. W21_SRS_FM6]|uniref:Hsp70 family protein n=1 Tax=Flavobacterium sp. W21_SRS_FM6 TaxID=3240268 RepID=UPI003F92286B
MSKMINFGIDLGTTNSLIAKFNSGVVQVFKNPRGHKEGLPSIVGFRKDKILVGDKARDYATKDPKNVKSRFKRKMGTTETFKIDSINSSKTPEELSAFVLKELKGFVQSGEIVDSAVITIPASFDTIQSNATKDAGMLAGLNEVLLLQEPIAASLAYANKDGSVELKNSQWIVYDLGGGTFDVALVKIVEGELTVIDHEGDNYFGGTDLDALIVEKILVPHIETKGSFDDLLGEMKSASGKHEKSWYRLLDAAETAKIELSSDSSTEIEFQIEDDEGEELEGTISVTRSQFESLIKDRIEETTKKLKNILTRQSLQPKDLEFVLMVGGSTYIPFVRKQVQELMNIPVNTDIDPTNAIVIGAAYYAGSRTKSVIQSQKLSNNNANIKVKATYVSNTQDSEELFAAKIDGDIVDLTYRIHSANGIFDSGIKPLSARINEELPLREGEFNIFEFTILDSNGNKINHLHEQIQIAQGRYSVAGQMLPDELSLVKDDLSTNDTKLEKIFEKNSILPSRAKRTVEVAKTIIKGGVDGSLKIMVVEGSSDNHALSNKPIGVLEINGEKLTKDLLKGSEIDITFEISESRDLTISAYLNGTDQEFSQIFNPQKRNVSPKQLGADILQLEETIYSAKEDTSGNSEVEKELSSVLKEVQDLILVAGNLSEDSITDEKFKLEDQKRLVAQKLHQITSSRRLEQSKSSYKEAKKIIGELVDEAGNDQEKHRYREIIRREEVFLTSTNHLSIETAKRELNSIESAILLRTPAFLVNVFEYLIDNRVSMNDQFQANSLIDTGKNLIQNQQWNELSMVNGRLWDLMPQEKRDVDQTKFFTGIV